MGERGGAPSLAASRSWTPLALTLGLHLLLVLAWLTGAHKSAPEPAPRASTLVLVRPLERPKPAPALRPPPRPLPRTRQPAAFAPPLPEPAIESTAAASPDPEPAGAAQPDAAPVQTLPGELLASSKAMAGRIDRELRKGASPITAEPERKWERFAEAFAAARKNAPNTVTLERYTAPDGVLIYRKTAGGKARCYRSGSVGGLVTGFGNADGHGAGSTTCPSGVSWTRL